jgi:hypothetical protein
MARCMGWWVIGPWVLVGCADVGGGDDTNPFGEGTAGVSATAGATAATGEDDDTASTGAETSTGTPTTGTPTTGEGTSSGEGPGESTSSPGDSSGGGGGGALGECIGLGAWETCAQYCEAVTEVCVEAGCDGSTVVYYGDVAACTAMRPGDGAATPCDEGFAMGGGASFGRCCCQ